MWGLISVNYFLVKKKGGGRILCLLGPAVIHPKSKSWFLWKELVGTNNFSTFPALEAGQKIKSEAFDKTLSLYRNTPSGLPPPHPPPASSPSFVTLHLQKKTG